MTTTRWIEGGCVALVLASWPTSALAQKRCPQGQERTAEGQCAPPDRDGDGIADDLDKCPSDAEDQNGFEDQDGCPDEPRRARDAAAREAASTRESSEHEARVAACFDSVEQRQHSARGGFTSQDSVIEAMRGCIAQYPASARAASARAQLSALEAERDGKTRQHQEAERARREALADDYAQKARFQTALGASFAVVAAGASAATATFLIAQPLGKDDVANTVVGSVCLGFAVIFGVESYLRFVQASVHAKSAKSIRPVALGPSGLSVQF